MAKTRQSPRSLWRWVLYKAQPQKHGLAATHEFMHLWANMAFEKVKASDQATKSAELLILAQSSNLRACNASQLRDLVRYLEVACETARVAALRNVMGPEHGKQSARTEDQNCGFARLFTGLRRARSELKRREKVKATGMSCVTEGRAAPDASRWNFNSTPT